MCGTGRSIACSCKLRLRLRTKSSLQKGAFNQGKQRRVDPRTTLIRAACWHLPLFSARPPQAEKACTATQIMLQNDVLENGIFKPRPKLAESSSKQARLAPSQLVGDGGAVDGRRSGRLQLAVGSGMITASAASPKV